MNRFGLSKHVGIIGCRPAASSTSQRFLTGTAQNQPELHSIRNTSVWVALIDPYLPEPLRRRQHRNRAVPFELQTRRDIQRLPCILERARGKSPHSLDLLYYLGSIQKRWEAVMWLVKAILRLDIERLKAKDELDELRAPSWSHTKLISLEQLSAREIWADNFIKPLKRKRFNHETLTKPTELIFNARKGMGQIWQSLGYMILQAAELPEEGSDAKVILSHVFEILAHMHHTNVLPSTIYNWTPPRDPFVVQRPPTLSQSSFRIMTILADTAWKVHESETKVDPTSIDARNAYKGQDISTSIPQLQVRRLRIGIWLDLILWSCIEGGWISEAMWIVNEIDRRKENKKLSWSVMRWEPPHKSETSQLNWSVKVEQAISKSRMNQIAGGIGVAGHGPDSPTVHMPPRTISREVILALIDGLANMSGVTSSTQHKPLVIQQHISTCKRLLATEGYGLETYTSNSIIVRLVGSAGVDVMREPAVFEQILCLSPAHGNEIPASASRDFANRTPHELAIASSAVYLGLLHQALYMFARLGDVQGTLRTFYRTQALIDANSQQRLENFMNEVTQPKLDIDEDLDSDSNSDSTDEIKSLALHSQIPVHVLIVLLELVIEAKLFDFGNCLLHSDDIHDPAIPPELYAQTDLQPALLQFATATANTSLQIKVTEKLEVPLRPSVLQSLIYSHVELGNWSSVEKILRYVRGGTGNGWHPEDLMRLASFVLRMENGASKGGHLCPDKTTGAIALLRKFFSGEFNSPRNPAEMINLYQVRRMNQLFRILKRCPGKLSKLTSPYAHERANESISIPVKAFNILVDGVVESKGSRAGKKLWNLWCLETHGDDSVKRRNRSSSYGHHGGPEGVVQPNLQTLRTILRPAIQAGIDAKNVRKQTLPNQTSIKQTVAPVDEDASANHPSTSQDVGGVDKNKLTNVDHGILEWGRKRFTEFGLSREEIALEIPWYL